MLYTIDQNDHCYKMCERFLILLKDPRADVTKVLFDAYHRCGFKIGVYYVEADWHNPDY